MMYKSRLKAERVAFHNPVRKEHRDRIYREMATCLLEKNHDVLIEDKRHCLHIIDHKLDENDKEKKP